MRNGWKFARWHVSDKSNGQIKREQHPLSYSKGIGMTDWRMRQAQNTNFVEDVSSPCHRDNDGQNIANSSLDDT